MTDIDPSLVDDIFSNALELDEAERTAYVKRRCTDNVALQQRVLRLLDATKTDDDILDRQFSEVRDRLLCDVLSSDGDDVRDQEDLSGQRVGYWRIERRLARGGLATVYEAHRDDGEYEQRAALKVLRRGLDTDDLVTRFKAERQILSALEHSGIANILDGGALPDGRPYLVLEFVDGMPITEHCRIKILPLRDRVILMLQVLRALQHAHRHLIVHRDIKPSNILVSDEGQVSLLDFGIAKLLDPDALPGASTLTRTGMSMLTPGYCSPEQQAGAAVTTASDIYQAGAVLYELLTGTRPRLQKSQTEDMDLPLPSQLLKGETDYDRVRGDLDAIVHKAMHVEPTLRYSSAEEMDSDLERYLDGRPVLAQPDTAAYRLRKLHRRKPWLIPVSVIAIATIVAFIVTLLLYNRQLFIEQQRTQQAQEFMVDILSSADPFQPADPDRGRDITVVEALDLGVERMDENDLDDPKLRAIVLSAIASVYANLDQHAKAIQLQEEALQIQQALYGDASKEVVESMKLLASQYRSIGEFEKAIDLQNSLLATAESVYGVTHPVYGEARVAAAELANALGDTESEEAHLQDAIAILDDAGDEYAQTLIGAELMLAYVRQFEAPAEAISYVDRAARIAKSLYGATSPTMGRVFLHRATMLSNAGRYDEAVTYFHRAIEIYEERLGKDHGATLTASNNLGVAYFRMGRYREAGDTYRNTLDRYIGKYGEYHAEVAGGYQNLATSLSLQGRFDESIPMHQKAFEMFRQVLPEDQAVVAYPLFSKAFAEVGAGRYDDAEATALMSLEIIEKTAGDTYLVGIAECLVARAKEGLGDSRGTEFMSRAHDRLVGSLVNDTYREFCRVPKDAAVVSQE